MDKYTDPQHPIRSANSGKAQLILPRPIANDRSRGDSPYYRYIERLVQVNLPARVRDRSPASIPGNR
jgi:hypothetical protein